MKLGNVKDRAVLITDEGAIDVATASDGRFGPALRDVYARWDDFVAAAPSLTGPVTSFDECDLGAPSPMPAQVFAIGLVQGVETLLAEDDAAWLAIIQKLRPFEMLRQHLKVLESDFVAVVIMRDGFIRPRTRIVEILGVGVPRHVPVEVAALTHQTRKGIEEVSSWRSFLRTHIRHATAPMMIGGEVGARVLRVLANRSVHNAKGLLILTRGRFQRHQPHVVPQEVRVDLIADDPTPGSTMFRMRTAPALGQHTHHGI